MPASVGGARTEAHVAPAERPERPRRGARQGERGSGDRAPRAGHFAQRGVAGPSGVRRGPASGSRTRTHATRWAFRTTLLPARNRARAHGVFPGTLQLVSRPVRSAALSSMRASRVVIVLASLLPAGCGHHKRAVSPAPVDAGGPPQVVAPAVDLPARASSEFGITNGSADHVVAPGSVMGWWERQVNLGRQRFDYGGTLGLELDYPGHFVTCPAEQLSADIAVFEGASQVDRYTGSFAASSDQNLYAGALVSDRGSGRYAIDEDRGCPPTESAAAPKRLELPPGDDSVTRSPQASSGRDR